MAAPKRLATAALALGFALAACGGDGGADPAPDVSPITYTVSGVYPPFGRELTIDPDGKAILKLSSIDGDDQRIRFTVPDDVVADLQADLEDADIGGLTAEDSQCVDCIKYRIDFDGETLSVDMLSVPAELEPAFKGLDQVIDGVPEARDSAEEPAPR